MIEMSGRAEALDPGMIAVARDAVVSGLSIGRPAVVRRPMSSGLWQTMQRGESAPLSGA